jgi:hypothetical protein
MKSNKAIQRIEELLRACSEGKTVSRRDISRVLSPVLLREFDEAWEVEKSSRKDPKPLGLVKYEALLKKGLLAFGQYEAKHKVLPAYQSKKMNQSAESSLEKALLYAVELLQIEPELIVWFDRDPRDVRSIDPISIPRLVTSKSAENQASSKSPPLQQSKNSVKETYLARALEELRPDSSNLEILSVPNFQSPFKSVRKKNYGDFNF